MKLNWKRVLPVLAGVLILVVAAAPVAFAEECTGETEEKQAPRKAGL